MNIIKTLSHKVISMIQQRDLEAAIERIDDFNYNRYAYTCSCPLFKGRCYSKISYHQDVVDDYGHKQTNYYLLCRNKLEDKLKKL